MNYIGLPQSLDVPCRYHEGTNILSFGSREQSHYDAHSSIVIETWPSRQRHASTTEIVDLSINMSGLIIGEIEVIWPT